MLKNVPHEAMMSQSPNSPMRSPRNGSLCFPTPDSSQSGRGFTLVEVTLALGIISFAFVAMFGLLPVGLSVSRQAIDTTIEAQIVQKLTSQALQTDFSQLSKLDPSIYPTAASYYFDNEGKTASQTNALYKAGFSVATSTSLSANVNTQKLATVSIFVLNTKGNAARASALVTSSTDARKFTILIPDNGL